jgi:Cu/Ag efflux protein CusF
MMRAIKFMGTFALVLTMSAFAWADETKGTIKTVDEGRREVVLKGLVKDTIYELNKDAMVWLDGTKSKLADLRADDTAHITFEKKGDHMMAIYVRVLRNAKDATGTVRSVSSQKNEVTLKGLVKDTTYELSKNTTVWINRKQVTLADVREGDEVRITYEQRGDHLIAAEVDVMKRK